MKMHLLLALVLVSGVFAQATAEEILGGEQASTSLLGAIAKDWQVYTVLVLLLMVGLVALAYVLANAFSLPDLKAWADVELGEIFASALVLIVIIGVVFFVDEVARGTIGSSFQKSCEKPGFCPANIAYDYLGSYITSSSKLYGNIAAKAIDKGKEATEGHTVGIQDLIYGYLTFRFRVNPQELITFEMYDQLLQNVGTLLNALYTQKFFVKILTFKLAPIAIFLGIILRSFFLTRKLGGLLLAFGLGFLIVYPLTYALAWFTLDAAVYGAQTAKTGVLGACPKACLPESKIVEYTAQYEGAPTREVSTDEIKEAAKQDCLEYLAGELNDEGRSISCLADAEADRNACVLNCDSETRGECNEDCKGACEAAGYVMPASSRDCLGSDEEHEACVAEWTIWDGCFGQCMEETSCTDAAIQDRCEGGCLPAECPVGPTSDEEKDEFCDGQANDKLGEMGKGVIRADDKYYGYCKHECGYPFPYNNKDCIQMQYSTPKNVCNQRLFDSEDPAYSQLDAASELQGCPDECRSLAPMKDIRGCYNYKCLEMEGGTCKRYGPICPSQCMWMTTSGRTESGCPEECSHFYHAPDVAEALWEGNRSNDTCVYIIPDVVFEQPEKCSACAFVAEKGLTMKPQVILDCTRLCGAPSNQVMAEDPATMTNNIGGMVGPTDVVSVSKLMIPAYVLPLFSLAVTLMFVLTLSPMLGGDIDLPGMMRMIS